MAGTENTLLHNRHVLICVPDQIAALTNVSVRTQLKHITVNFCGIVFDDLSVFNKIAAQENFSPDAIIYLCGDIETNCNIIKASSPNLTNLIRIVKEASYNYDLKTNTSANIEQISIGQVPLNIHNVGVYFRTAFCTEEDYFGLISGEHAFQNLTESNKQTNAYRTGIYLTKVDNDVDKGEINFKLLRCSSNLRGPTDNFRKTDIEIIRDANNISKSFFKNSAELNHVLAQIYENKKIDTLNKKVERKAKISEHSDKTKDMEKNGLIAFCTFYKNIDYFNSAFIKKSNIDEYDYCHNSTSVLTKLKFRLKPDAAKHNPLLKNQFDVVLYPNSMFIISLYTNRLYTHEIVPSVLPIDKIPTRLGYVIRSSKTSAVFKNECTYTIDENNTCAKLEEPAIDQIVRLKKLYAEENLTSNIINYEKFNFSLNEGDYTRPLV